MVRRFQVLSHLFIPHVIGARRDARLDLFLPGEDAEIARARGICHGGSCPLWRDAGSLANAAVSDEGVRGLLIKRSRPREAVLLFESQERPLCLRAYCAVERAILEPQIVKLYCAHLMSSFERLAAFSQRREVPGAEDVASPAFGTPSSASPFPVSDAFWIRLKEVVPSGRIPHSSPSR